MKDIARLKLILSDEQLKVMEEVFEKREMVLEGFKLMRKDYSNVKNNVKRVEKKMMAIIEAEGPDYYAPKWIEREIASIENKYKDIEYAIKHYNLAMKSFNTAISSPHFYSFNPHERASYGWGSSPVQNLKNYLSSAEGRINDALNAIRITKRYFKNCASHFKSYGMLKAAQKQKEQRLRLNEMKLEQQSQEGLDNQP